MPLQLSHLIPEQRAVRDAELAFDRAEQVFIANVVPGRGCKSWGARARYFDAAAALQYAVARLEKIKCELSGTRHLRVASPVVT